MQKLGETHKGVKRPLNPSPTTKLFPAASLGDGWEFTVIFLWCFHQITSLRDTKNVTQIRLNYILSNSIASVSEARELHLPCPKKLPELLWCFHSVLESPGYTGLGGFLGGFKRKVYGGKDFQHEHIFPVCLCLIFPSLCPTLGRFTVVNLYIHI